jgi:hypothetical protein
MCRFGCLPAVTFITARASTLPYRQGHLESSDDARASKKRAEPKVRNDPPCYTETVPKKGIKMKQNGKIAWGVLIAFIVVGLAYAEVKADAALNTELGLTAESNAPQVLQGE